MASNILGSLLLLIKTKGDVSGLNKTDKAIKKTTKSLQKMSKSTGIFSSLSNKLFRGFNLTNLWGGAMGYLQFEKDLGAIHSRFYALTKDHKQATEEFDYIRKVAKDTAMDIKKTADSYSIFYSSTRNTLGKEGARGVFEDWTRVGRVLHLSEYQFERVTYALREMASKGAIYSQDLRMQIGTHVPNAMGLAQKAAEQMGITGTDWFEKLQKMAKGNNKITTEFVRLFSKEARKAYGGEEAFKEAMKQPDALAQTIKNTAFEIGYSFSKSGGGYMVVKILEGIKNVIEKIPFDEITKVVGNIAKGVGIIAQYLPEIFFILKDIAFAMIAFRVSKWLGVLGKNITAFWYAFKQGKFLALALSKMGFKDLAFAMVKGGLKKIGLKALIATAMNGVPLLGQIVSIAMWIWTAIDVIQLAIKAIRDKMGIKQGGLGEYFANTGYKTSDVGKIARDLAKSKPMTTWELNETLRKQGHGDLVPYFYFDEKHNIVVNVNGVRYEPDEIIETKTERSKNNKIPPKPRTLDRQESIKFMQGK